MRTPKARAYYADANKAAAELKLAVTSSLNVRIELRDAAPDALPTTVAGWIRQLNAIAANPKGRSVLDGHCTSSKSGTRAALDLPAAVAAAFQATETWQNGEIARAAKDARYDRDANEQLDGAREELDHLSAAARLALAAVGVAGWIDRLDRYATNTRKNTTGVAGSAEGIIAHSEKMRSAYEKLMNDAGEALRAARDATGKNSPELQQAIVRAQQAYSAAVFPAPPRTFSQH